MRYCDDFVLGFEHEADARRMRADLKERLAKFKLALHEEKTRLIEFGRRPSELRRKCGARRGETFRFLGYALLCVESGGTFRGEAPYRPHAAYAETSRTEYPGAAADAYAGGVAIPMAVQRFARTLRLLRFAEQLGPAWCFLPRDAPHLASGA